MKITEVIEPIINVDGFDHQLGDLEAAAEWLGQNDINIDLIEEPIELFMPQIKEMYDTYKEFPNDSKRTKNILEKLKRGEPEYPIYVKKGDSHRFVMEGRHRMVAFWLVGLKNIPVAYVS